VTSPYQSSRKAERFQDLAESVQHCDLCPRLCGSRKVLSAANGALEARVLFVAEAPGRLGADRTGVPLCGDRTGDNFEMLLANIGWRREQVFITNAVLCNPKEENGNNGTPTPEEIENCSAYLEMVITLVSPEVVVTLGATALRALDLLAPHGVELREGVARLVPWRSYRIFPLYHPGPRATIHRSLAKQRSGRQGAGPMRQACSAASHRQCSRWRGPYSSWAGG
jgi:uracil-DNA glycosylase family 4